VRPLFADRPWGVGGAPHDGSAALLWAEDDQGRVAMTAAITFA
jgi:hypothetical protein